MDAVGQNLGSARAEPDSVGAVAPNGEAVHHLALGAGRAQRLGREDHGDAGGFRPTGFKRGWGTGAAPREGRAEQQDFGRARIAA
jgi:hypothetical protein